MTMASLGSRGWAWAVTGVAVPEGPGFSLVSHLVSLEGYPKSIPNSIYPTERADVLPASRHASRASPLKPSRHTPHHTRESRV